jgi:hypothetical protein
MLLLCCLSVVSWGQKDKWMLYPNKVDFDAGPGFSPYNFSAPSPSLGVPYLVENAVFGTDGELYFYIQDGCVYDKNGALNGCFAGDGLLIKEIGIAPVPGQCRAYCIFFMETFAPVTLSFRYFEVIIDEQTGLISFVSSPVPADGYGGNTGSLTVSPAIEGTGGERHIYVAANAMGAVYRYRMTAAAVVPEGVVATFPPSNGEASEVELSPCNSHLAWTTGGIAYVRDLLTGQQYSLDLGPRDFSGLEFSASSGCRDLILSHQAHGIVIWRYAQGEHLIIPGTEAFNKTQIERVKDGDDAMYLVKDGGDAGMLWKLDLIGGFDLSPVIDALPVYSNYDYVYTLPDQIDGEGDDAFFGVPPLYLTGLGIDGFSLPASHPDAPAYYNCGPIDLNIGYEGAPVGYTIGITSVNPATGEPVSGSGYLEYQGSFAGAPPAAIDLRCLEDPLFCDLFDDYEGQMFLVSVTIRNRCFNGEASGYFRVFGAPGSPADIDFRILAGDGPVAPAPSTDIGDPVESTVFGTLDLTNSNGDITFYRLQVWEVDCSTGQELAALYDSGPKTIASVSELAFNLAALEIAGTTNYFGIKQYDLDQRCIKASVELGNNCGVETAFSYIKFREIMPPIIILAGGGWQEPHQQAAVSVYPNPTSGDLSLALSIRESGEASVHIFDAAGRPVLRREGFLERGASVWQFSLAGQPAGAYYYQVQTASGREAGKLIKW